MHDADTLRGKAVLESMSRNAPDDNTDRCSGFVFANRFGKRFSLHSKRLLLLQDEELNKAEASELVRTLLLGRFNTVLPDSY